MDPSDPKEGNLPDIRQAGSVHEFLSELHAKYGPIASFWLETKLAVSLASPELFNEHMHVFDRPGELFEVFKPLIGKNSIFYANGTSNRQQSRLFGEILSQAANPKYYSIYKEMVEEMIKKLETVPADQHIPLHQYMMALAIKLLLVTMFGQYFRDGKNVLQLSHNLKICILDIEQKIHGKGLDDNISQKKKVEKAIEEIRLQMKLVINSQKNLQSEEPTGLFAQTYSKMKGSDDQFIDNAITIIYQGFQATGSLLTWLLYYVITHKSAHDRLLEEIELKVGDRILTEEILETLSYLRQVVDETLRISCLHPFAARVQDIEVELGGHVIPKDTPVLHALGVVLKSEAIWPSPEKFDPERFSEEQIASRPSLAFSPFGFAGKRVCPGRSFVYTVSSIILVEMIRKLRMTLVDDQVVHPMYSIVTQPESEIWVAVKKTN